MKNRIFSAIALTALVGATACERREETRIETPATTEAPATAPAPTMTPAPMGDDTLGVHGGMDHQGMMHDTLPADTL
jgi:hypothetical protein